MQQGSSSAWMRAAGSMTLATAALLTLPPSSLVFAQDTASPVATAAPPSAASGFTAVVTGTTVNLRSGPSAQSAYVFGKLRGGDTVQVIAEEFGWARVRAVGPAFNGMYAYVPADRRVSLAADGTSAQVTARTDLRAPNIDAGGAPDKSWKQIGQVDAGATLTVLGTVPGEKDSVYKVALPNTAEGWVNMQFLRRANEQEAAALAASLAPATAPVITGAHSIGGQIIAVPTNDAPAGAPVSVGAQQPAPHDPAHLADALPGSPSIPPLLGEPERAVPAGTRLDSHGEGSIETPATARPAQQSRRATWADLEAQWKAVREQPQATAELAALRERYIELARTSPEHSAIVQMASTRAEQLGLLQEAQAQAQELVTMRNRLSERSQAVYQLVLDMQSRADYAAVGVLNASVVYDGKTLPQLYRITDPQTSQTISYVLPNESLPMGTMVGTLVGVKGGKQYDSALNLNVISPQVIELLTVRESPQASKVETRTEQSPPAAALADKVAVPDIPPTTSP